jgi:hypothetical protein
MNASTHLKISGVLQIVQGVMMLLFGAYGVVGNFFNSPWPDSLEPGELSEIIYIILIIACIFLAGGLQVWFGRSLVMQKQWTTRVGGFICCIPGLCSWPFLISVYTLVVLVMVQVNKKKAKKTEPIN